MKITPLLALAILTVSGLTAQDLTGTWQGVVKNPDTKDELRTVIKVASSEGNPIKANFYSIDQTFLVFPATISLQAGAIKIEIPGIAASYSAKLSPDRNSMTGTLKGFSVPITWTMARVSSDKEWSIPKPPIPLRPMAADANPAFDVAAIKPSAPDAKGRGTRIQGASVSTLNMTLLDLMTFAFDVHPHQIIGAPAWATTERYDITGKPDVEGQPNADQFRTMMRKLLADRFQLVFQKEQRELPVYALSVAKGGAKISQNTVKNETSGVIFRGPGSVLFNNLAMDELCKTLGNAALDRPVVNQTGLQGRYDFSLVWTPEQLPTSALNQNALSDKGDAPPDLYTAIQQQLGLKIDAAKLSIEVLILDKLEKPSAN